MSTSVARGRGKGIVVRSGNASEIGRISQAICSTPHVKTSLEKNLGFLAKVLVGGAVVLCVIIILIGIGYKKETKETVMLGISLAVSVIPESLVAVVTVAMSLGVGRMSRKNAIVRKLPAVESLGSVTVICSDKVCRFI
jgi:Ca2+-transporting ATPase